MLRDGRNELLGGKDFKVALGLGMHPRAVDDGAVLGVVDHLPFGEGIPDDVLRNTFKPGGIVTPQRLAVVYAEPTVFPAQELAGELRGEQLLLDEHLDDPDTKELLQRLGAHPGRDVEHAVVGEKPVGRQGVSRRTVARDLDFLRDEENAPVEYDESRKGYRLTDGRTWPRVRCTVSSVCRNGWGSA